MIQSLHIAAAASGLGTSRDPGTAGTLAAPGITAVAPSRLQAAKRVLESDLDRLLARMRGGDREAAAAFMAQYGSRVRRRIRGKLSPTMRRIYDSDEVMSTVGRRLDLYVRAGRLVVESQEQLWALLFRMANNAVIDKARVFRHLETIEGPDAPFAHHLLSRLRDAEQRSRSDAEFEIENAFGALSDDIDRQVLSLWLDGALLESIADELGLSLAAVRKRWTRIQARLREWFGDVEA